MHATKGEDNRSYGIILKLRWAISAFLDLLIAFPLSKNLTRNIAAKMLSVEQKKTLDVYKNAKAAFVKGGGFLHSYGGITESYKIYFFLYHINLALSMGIPVYVMPNSYGPFADKCSRKMIRKCLSKCKIVYSRESVSQGVLRFNCNVESKLSRDLAMYLEKDSMFDAVKYLADKGINLQNGKMVGITVRPYRFLGKKNAADLYLGYKTAICRLILWLQEKNYHPVLIEHVYSDNYHERDIICIDEILKMVCTEGHRVDVLSALELNCRQMKSIYSKMDYLVGTRFHSVIFSLTECVPSIAITYGGNKGNGIMKDLGLDQFAIPITNITTESLKNKFSELVNNRMLIMDRLSQNRDELHREFQTIVDRIKMNGA